MADKKKGSGLREQQSLLNEQIKNEDFSHIYLICGEQDYLRTQNKNKLCKAIQADADDMNVSVFTGDGFTVTQVIDMSETLPFFAERRLIVVEESWVFGKSSSEVDKLTEYLARIPETSYLVFVQSSLNKTQKLFKAIKKYGFIMDCETPDEGDLKTWAAGRFAVRGFRITAAALRLFLDDAGEDMLNIVNESDKLMDYCGDRADITEEDVKAICSVRVKDRIFDMISAVSGHNSALAMNIYMELIKLQTPPQVILSLMIRQYNQLLNVGELLQSGRSESEIASMLRMNPWVLHNKIRPMLRGQTAGRLIKVINDCVQADQDYKSGRSSDVIAVEKLIVSHSTGAVINK